MKYLTMTFAIAGMAFGFASIAAIPAQASEEFECWWWERPECATEDEPLMTRDGAQLQNESPSLRPEINDVESLQQVAINDDDRLEDCLTRKNSDGMTLCVVTDEDGNERVAGIEVPDGVEFADSGSDWGWWLICMSNPERCNGDESTQDAHGNTGETEGEQVADKQSDYWEWCRENTIECREETFVPSTKTASGTFYPLPMITVAEMDKLLASSGASVASFDKILAPGGTAVESDEQFADREDGSGGDLGESGGDDFGEGDRAAASTAAE